MTPAGDWHVFVATTARCTVVTRSSQLRCSHSVVEVAVTSQLHHSRDCEQRFSSANDITRSRHWTVLMYCVPGAQPEAECSLRNASVFQIRVVCVWYERKLLNVSVYPIGAGGVVLGLSAVADLWRRWGRSPPQGSEKIFLNVSESWK